MNSNIFYNEIKRFILNNLKLILGITLATVAAFLMYEFVISTSEEPIIDENEFGLTEEIPTHIARFRFYVETSNEQHIGNANLFQHVFLQDHLVSRVESATSTNIQDWLDWQEEVEFTRTVEDPGMIGLSRDGNSETIVFKTRIGTESESLAIAEYYQTLLEEGEIPFFNNKEVYVLEDAYVGRPTENELAASYPEHEINRVLDEAAIESSGQNTQSNLLMTILKIIISIIAGLIFGLVIAYFKTQFSKDIQYAFNYERKQNDLFFKAENNQSLGELISNPLEIKSIVLTEDLALKDMIVNAVDEKKEVIVGNNILNYLPSEKLQEIAIIVDEHSTTKKWYYAQREILKSYHQDTIKVLQINSKIMN